MTIMELIVDQVRKWPGRTQREIAALIYKDRGVQQRVNRHCALLVALGRIVQRGTGGPSDPFRYYPA